MLEKRKVSYGSLCALCALCGSIFFGISPSRADENQWAFLPKGTVFKTLIGDPREPYTGITAYLNQVNYEGAVGETFEFLRYTPPDQTQWGWGVFGQGYILLGEDGATFPMQAADWYAGMYLSEASGPFSWRGEFVHQSAHLGDSLQGDVAPIFFSRENFNLTASFQPLDEFRLYAKAGDWENIYPRGDDPLFCSWGTEIYSPATDFAGTFLRGYLTADFQWKNETQSLNKNFELGFQWKFKKEENRDVRLALIYYNGLSDFGQFYQNPDEHWAVGLYFDP